MPDDKKKGAIHSSSEGGTAGIYPAPDPSEFLVAPSTSTESNNINLNLFLTAYMCISDIRFKFDSSFVLPAVQAEMQAFSSLRKQNPQVMGSPISIFGHADPSFQGNFEVGSQYAKSGDDYNKTLSGRRAIAIYALLIRDPSFWNTLYTKHLGSDIWGEDSIRIMLDALRHGGSSGSGGSSQNSSDSAKNSRVHDIANDSGQRQQLFLQYMTFLCGDLKLDKSADFLARNAGPDQKGDVQGCSRFNPLLLFSSEDEAGFKQAFADKDETTLRGERDPRNAVNRRVMILIFKKGSQVLPAKWPCPSYKDGTAGCIKRFWSDGNTRRSTHTSGAERKFELSADTFACRFYQRISGDKSPCNSTSPPPPSPEITAKKNDLVVVFDKTGSVPAAYPILQFDLIGPPNWLFDVQVSRHDSDKFTAGPGLAGAWDKSKAPKDRLPQRLFSSWTNGDKTLRFDGSGKATYAMPMDWWKDLARLARKDFSDEDFYYRVLAFQDPSGPLGYSTANGAVPPSVKIHNNLVDFKLTDNGYINGGVAKSVDMAFSVHEPNTTGMYTLVQWRIGSNRVWGGGNTYATVKDYNIIHDFNDPEWKIDRLETNPRYHNDAYTISDGGKTATTSDAPGGPIGASDKEDFLTFDFEMRIHLNFEVPAAVTITRKDGSPPVFGVVIGVLADPQPFTLDTLPWQARILQVRKADGNVDVSHPNTYAGP
jgi:hypothetical protein